MNKEIKKKWLAALRSGDYDKGTGALCEVTDEGARYCCLGVLEEVVNGDIWESSNGSANLSMPGEYLTHYPSKGTLRAAGIEDVTILALHSEVAKHCEYSSSHNTLTRQLAVINDSSETTFEHMADLIEKYL